MSSGHQIWMNNALTLPKVGFMLIIHVIQPKNISWNLSWPVHVTVRVGQIDLISQRISFTFLLWILTCAKISRESILKQVIDILTKYFYNLCNNLICFVRNFCDCKYWLRGRLSVNLVDEGDTSHDFTNWMRIFYE